MKTKTRIIVKVEGGLVSAVVSNDPNLSVEILDMDVQEEREEARAIRRDTALATKISDGKLHTVYGF